MKRNLLVRTLAGAMAMMMVFSGSYGDISTVKASELQNAYENTVSENDAIFLEESEASEDGAVITEEYDASKDDEAWKYFTKKKGTKEISDVSNEGKKQLSLVIPKDATKIGEKAFKDCDILEKVTFEAGSKCTVIADKAFAEVDTLKEIELPQSLVMIGESAFEDTGIREIRIPESVATLGESAFEGTKYLEKLVFADDSKITVIPEKAFASDNSVLTEISLPDTLEIIGESAFKGLSGLTGITIPEKIKTINSGAFSNCGIQTVSINSTVIKECDAGVFKGCKIKNVVFNKNMTRIPDHLFENATFDNAIIEIPSKVNFIGESSFCQAGGEKMGSIKQIVFLGSSVKEIGKCAFQGANIKDISLPSSVKTIYESAFEGCTGFTSITIPEGVLRIKSLAFANCPSLVRIYIPKSVHELATLEGTKTPFTGCSANMELCVIKGSYASAWARAYSSKCGFKYTDCYAIKYSLGSGTINDSKNTGMYTEGQEIVLHTPVRYGYTFSYWKYGKQKLYPDADGTYRMPAPGKNITVTAKWIKNRYTVTFDSNGGKEIGAKSYNIGSTKTLKKPTWKGHVFKGWYLDGVKITKLKKGVYYGGDIRLVAQWKKGKCTVTFDGNGAEVGEMEATAYTCGDFVVLPKCKFEREGYTFLYWTYKGEVAALDEGEFFVPDNKSVVLKACWEKNDTNN